MPPTTTTTTTTTKATTTMAATTTTMTTTTTMPETAVAVIHWRTMTSRAHTLTLGALESWRPC
jgi:cell division septation protein DedD